MKRKHFLLTLLSRTLLMIVSMSSYALDNVNGVYQISTASDFQVFAEIVNGGEENANAVLTDDIDMSTLTSWTPIGDWNTGAVSSAYCGHFDGQGHTIKGFNGTSSQDYYGIFGVVSTGGLIENFTIYGTLNLGHKTGGVIGFTRDATPTIRNIHSYLNINCTEAATTALRPGGIIGTAYNGTTIVENCTYSGIINVKEHTGNIGGIIGYINNNIATIVNITNCLFNGEIQNGTSADGQCGGIVGYNNSGKTTIKNCLSIGNIISSDGNIGQFIGRLNGSNTVFANNYYLGNFVNGTASGKTAGGETPVQVTTNQLASGELCFKLNDEQNGLDRFYQLIGTDPEPMPIKKEGALVYASFSSYRCDGQPLGEATYCNTPNTTTIPPHQYEEGFCIVCEELQDDYLTPVDGWFEIKNGAELVWWTNYASKNLGVNARLTADIDMEGYCDRWANVGTEDSPFYGNFDGQFHTISNLVVVKPQSRGVGLIAVMNSLPSAGYGGISDADARAAKGVYIKDVVLDESCFLLGYGYIGLVGMTAPWAGHVNIRGVMMCGNVTANGGPNASGVFGCVMSSACRVTIDNCGMVGDVYGPKENGSLSGWLGSYAEVTNCFAVGSVESIQDDAHYFARYGSDGVKFTNCYAKYGTQVPTISDENLTSGALAYSLNGNHGGVERFYQKIGEDLFPMPIKKEGALVYEIKHLHCNGDIYELPVFSNENNNIMDKHNIVDGICSYCGFSEKDDIYFADANVKAICVSNWDTDGDGWLSYDEAAAITSLGEVFKKNTSIKTFNELQYFISLQSIGNSAFFGCNSLTSIIIPQNVTSIGNYAFGNCRSLTSVTIPNIVTSIGNYTFANCSNLTSFTIPDNVTSIGKSAFYGCRSLTSITIPESMMSIGEGSFAGCSGLTCVTSFIEEPYACSAFDNDTYNHATLYVPFGTFDSYSSTDDWKNFNSIEEMPQKKTNLVLWAKDGSTVAFALSKKPKITFTETDLQIAGESIDITYSLDNLAQFTYETDDYVTTIKDIDTEEVSFKLIGESLLFPALKVNNTVSVYTLNGMLVFKKTIQQSGEYVFPLSNLNTGVYMINVNGLTYKIMKK